MARELELATGDKILEWNDKDIFNLKQNIENTSEDLHNLMDIIW